MSNYQGRLEDSQENKLLVTPHSMANIEDSDTASQIYTVGNMLVFNNRLCKVTAAIAQGDTLEIGTNIAYKGINDIGQQLCASDGKEFYFDVKDGEYGYYPSASKVPAEFVPFGGTPLEYMGASAGFSSYPAYYFYSIYRNNSASKIVNLRVYTGTGSISNLKIYGKTTPITDSDKPHPSNGYYSSGDELYSNSFNANIFQDVSLNIDITHYKTVYIVAYHTTAPGGDQVSSAFGAMLTGE